MGNRLTLPLLLVAAVLAGGAFFWLSGGERRAAPDAAPTAKAEPGDPSAPGELRDVDAAAAPGTAAAPERVELPAASQPAPAPRAAGAGLRVHGQVVDRRGEPVPGARVVASSQLGLPLDLSTKEQFPWFKRLQAVCDAQGRFELEGVEPGALQVLVRAPGFAPLTKTGIGIPKGGEHELEPLVLARGAVLSGIVVDPDGRGVAGAEIQRRDPGEERPFLIMGAREPTAVTGPDGRFRVDELACGAWRFVVRTERHPDLVVEGLADEPGVEKSGLRWQVAPGATITGSVQGVPEAERDGLEVRAQRAGSSEFFGLGAARIGAVDRGGRFEVAGLDPGQAYVLEARRTRTSEDFFERSRSTSATANAGDTGVVLQYQPEAALLFSVVDGKTGQPLEKLEVESGSDWSQPLRDEDGNARTFFPGGAVRIGGLRPGRADERVRLSVRATGYGEFSREDIAVRAGQELDLGVVRLEPVPVVRVRVLAAADGKPVADALVRMDKDEGEMRSMRRTLSFGESGSDDHIQFGEGRSARTDEDGWAELTSYEGATVKLSARATGYAPAEQRGIELPRGDSLEQELRLTLGGSVTVHVQDADGRPLAGAKVEHRGPTTESVMILGGGGPGTMTDSEGLALFENLEPGSHSFRLTESAGEGAFASVDAVLLVGGGGDEEEWSPVQVLEGEQAELTLRARPSGALTGRVRESGKLLAGATVKLERADRDPDAGPRMLLPGMNGGPTGKSDGEGRYRIDDVKEGKYTVSVEHPTRRMPQEYVLEVREGDNEFDIDLPLSIVEGRVLDAEQKPLAGIKVWAERRAEEGANPRQRFTMVIMGDDTGGGMIDSGELGGNSTLTDADGRYTLRGVASDVDLIVKAEGDTVQPGESATVRVSPDETRKGVDIELPAGGAIQVAAETPDGAPARFCMVRASFVGGGEDGPEPKVSFIQSGSTTLKGLKPGRWSVSVSRPDPGNPQNAGDEQEIEVKANETAQAKFTVE